MSLRILAFDPGKNEKSFAYTLTVDGTVHEYGSVRPIASLLADDFKTEVAEFHARLVDILATLKPDVIVIERFQDRGGSSKGSTSEIINVTLGIVVTTALGRNVSVCPVMPATWKTWLTRTYGIGKSENVKNLLGYLQGKIPQVVGRKGKPIMVVHEGDAIGMALWYYERHTGATVCIDGLFYPVIAVKRSL